MSHLSRKKTCIRFLVWILIILMLPLGAFAENAGEGISGSSDGESWFLVTTDPDAKKTSLTIQQTKGTMHREKHPLAILGGLYDGDTGMYERYYIRVEELTEDLSLVKNVTAYQTERKECTLDLNPGSVYRVTVTPLYVTWEEKMQDPSYALANAGNNPYLLNLDFFNVDKEHSFLDTAVTDLFRGNWLPAGWVKPATWKIASTKGIKSIVPASAAPKIPAAQESAVVPSPAPASPAAEAKPAPSASDFTEKEVSGSSLGESRFLVRTDPEAKKASLTIQQTKGTMRREKHPLAILGGLFAGDTGMYERYYIRVEELTEDLSLVKNVTAYQTEKKECTLDLDPGSVYRITVTPLYVTWEKKMQDPSYALANSGNNPYLLQFDFFDVDREHSFLDTVTSDISRGNWMPAGWVKPATWKIASTKGVKGIAPADVPSETAAAQQPTAALASPAPTVTPAPSAAGTAQPGQAVSGSVSYDPDLAISEAPSILDTVPKSGGRGASYVSRVLRAGGLEKVQEKGAGDLIDYLKDDQNWGRSIGTVLPDPRYDQLKKGDVLACVCAKGSNASDYTNGHSKGKGLYYGIQNFIISEVGVDYVKVYSATEHRYNETIRLSCNGGDLILTCDKCGDSRQMHWIAFSFADDILVRHPASDLGTRTAEEGWNAYPIDDSWGEWFWYYVQNGEILTGWQVIEGRTCYFHSDGQLASGITMIDGLPYFFMDMPYGYGPGDGGAPAFGFLCRGGFYSRADGSLVFTDDRGVALAWDGSHSPDGTGYFEYAFDAYDIMSDTPDIISCTFFDIDGDGVNEFITLSGQAMADMVYTFYRADPTRGEYRKVGQEYGYEDALVRDADSGHLLIVNVHAGWQYVNEITLEGDTFRSREIAVIDSEDGGYRYFGDSVYQYPYGGEVTIPPSPLTEVPEPADPVQSSTAQAGENSQVSEAYSLDAYMQDYGFTAGQRYETEIGSHTVTMWKQCYFNLPGGSRYTGDIMVGGVKRQNALAVFLDGAFQSGQTVTIHGTSYPLGTGTLVFANPGYDTFRFSFGALSMPDIYYGPPQTHGYYRLTVSGNGKALYKSEWLDYSALQTCSVEVSGVSEIRITIEMVTGTKKINGSKYTLNLGFFDMAFTSGRTGGTQAQATAKPASASSFTEDCDFFSVTLPASWKDRYIMQIQDAGVVQFFNKANAKAGYGGLLFSVYASTRVSSHQQLLDFSIDRNFPVKNGSFEVGCKYICPWDYGLVFALYDGTSCYNQNDPALSADYLDMYREIGAVLSTFQLDASSINGLADYIWDVEHSEPDWPYYGSIFFYPDV